MDYKVAADIVALSHLSIIILVFIGILVSIRFKRFRPFETAFLVVAIVLWSIYGNCPLTILEEHFRTLAGNPSGITSIGFIPYYANKLFAVGINSRVVNYSVYTTGVLFFLLSINWISPYLNFHLFHFRKSLRKLARAI